MKTAAHLPKSLFSIPFVLLILLSLPGVAWALGGGDGNPDLKTPKESLAKFRALKYGAFIHWNPSCQTGREISWCRGAVGREKHHFLISELLMSLNSFHLLICLRFYFADCKKPFALVLQK